MATKKKAKKVKLKVVLGPVHFGNAVFVRTVTGYYTGRVVGVTSYELLLSDAAWIADSGRWANMLAQGLDSISSSEIEPYPDGVISIGRGAIVDVCSYRHPLPRAQK